MANAKSDAKKDAKKAHDYFPIRFLATRFNLPSD